MAIVRFAVSKFPVKKSLRTINVFVVVLPSEETSEKEGPEYMNRWIRRALWVLLSPVLVPALGGLCIFALFWWVVMQWAESKNPSPIFMVSGASSCAVAMQKEKLRTETEKGTYEV